MKNNNSVFSPKLMLEGFRQCRTIGILAMIIMSLSAVFIPVGISISYDDSSSIIKTTETAYSINPFLLLVIPAISLITLVLFHFLDSRAASDLYHSLPHKRITLYVSFTASILLWAVLLIFTGTLCSVITCLILNKYILLVASTIIPYMISVFLITLLAVGGILIGMNLTGTVFTNILISGIILLLPRFCFHIIHQTIFENVAFLNFEVSQSGIFSNAANLLFGLISMILETGYISPSNIFRPEWYSIIYTFVLAVIYLAISGFIFCRRRSEAAGQSAPTRIHQHVYRIVVTMVYCIIITTVLINDISDYSDLSGEEIFVYFILYLIGVFIYMLYELITTRKLKNLITIIPGLGLVAVLNIAFAFGLNVTKDSIIYQCPKADEINSITIGLYHDVAILDYYDYVDMKNSETKITDKEIISTMSNYLDENVSAWKENETAYYEKYHNSGKYTSYTVTFDTDDGKLLRNIMIPNEESDKILSIIEKNPEYNENWKSLPKPVDNTIYLLSEYSIEFTDKEIKDLFEIYSQEIKELDFKQIYNNAETDCGTYFRYTFSENGYTKEIDCPIFSSIMPKTKTSYNNLIYNKQADLRNNIEIMLNSGKYESVDIQINNNDMYCTTCPSEELNEIYSHLSKYIVDEPIQPGGKYVRIHLWPFDYESDDSVDILFALDDKVVNDSYLKQLLFSENYYD